MEPCRLKLIASWNPARDVWEEATTGLFCEHSDVYSATWPSSGMTQSGTAYELPTSAPLTAASASSSLLPTPTLDDAGNITRDSGAFQSLTRSVGALLPTPAVNDMGEGKTAEHWDEWTATMQAKHGNGNGHGKSLAIEAQRLLPTPSVADGMGGHLTRSGARSDELLLPGVAKSLTLLPTPTAMGYKASGGSSPSDVTLTDAVVRTSFGATTNPRFGDGNAPSDDPPPHPPSPDPRAGGD